MTVTRLLFPLGDRVCCCNSIISFWKRGRNNPQSMLDGCGAVPYTGSLPYGATGSDRKGSRRILCL
jgi:hypothetical protein